MWGSVQGHTRNREEKDRPWKEKQEVVTPGKGRRVTGPCPVLGTVLLIPYHVPCEAGAVTPNSRVTCRVTAGQSPRSYSVLGLCCFLLGFAGTSRTYG